MSDIIHLLPDTVANQIAAGEVIQRPASVIKELVENAIDANATQVQVFVREAGKESIQVVDDGKGMSETDARLSFERHATSKISKADDLFALRTMGFRGEALASIAAVAQVELKTRRQEDDLATHIIIEGNRVISQEVIAAPKGANFLVKNLFYNVPARRKFLKSNQTELSNIVSEFERIALAHPDIAFRLTSNDTLLLDLPTGNFRQRIAAIFGKKTDKQLLPVKTETDVVTISGFVGAPESSKKRGAQQFFFVNGRFMRHPYFAKAVQSAFERYIPEGEQIPFFLHFTVEPASIDVNIHPTKTEIKFQEESTIWQILSAAIRESLGKFNAMPTIDFDAPATLDIPAYMESRKDIPAPTVAVDPSFNPFESSRPSGNNSPYGNYFDKPQATPQHWQRLYDSALRQPTQTVPDETPMLYDGLPESERKTFEKGNGDALQYRQRYIITSAKDGLIVVDQHRAHYRVLYDQFTALFVHQSGVSQGLLFAQEIELAPSLLARYSSLAEGLAKAGYDLTQEGENKLVVHGIPVGTEDIDTADFLQAIFSESAHGEVSADETIASRLADNLARRKAIPAGQTMTTDEMEHLLDELFACENPNYAPDGSKVLFLLPDNDIERLLQI